MNECYSRRACQRGIEGLLINLQLSLLLLLLVLLFVLRYNDPTFFRKDLVGQLAKAFRCCSCVELLACGTIVKCSPEFLAELQVCTKDKLDTAGASHHVPCNRKCLTLRI